jgi:hypothetical protein
MSKTHELLRKSKMRNRAARFLHRRPVLPEPYVSALPRSGVLSELNQPGLALPIPRRRQPGTPTKEKLTNCGHASAARPGEKPCHAHTNRGN